MNYRDFLKLKSEDWATSYLFSVNEFYLAEGTLRFMINFLDEAFLSFNFQEFTEQNFDEIKFFLERVPMMSDKKIAVISDYDLWQKKAGKISVDSLNEYIKDIGGENCLVIVDKKGIDKRSKLYKFFKTSGNIVEFPRANERELKEWVKTKFSEKGKVINLKELDYFLENTGYLRYQSEVSMYFLENEINKIAATNDSEISMERLKILTENSDNNIFKFLDALFMGDNNAFYHYDDLIKSGVAIDKIFYMVLREARILFEISILRKKHSDFEIQKILKLSSYENKKLITLSQKRDIKYWFGLFKKLENIDFLRKSQNYDIMTGMEIMISKLRVDK